MVAGGLWPIASGQSVFGTGRWWKLTVAADGVYRITSGDIPALAGTPVDSLAVYGMDGTMLSTSNLLTPTDGLRQLAIEVRDRNGNGLFDADDDLLFFGQGTERWSFDNSLQRWTFAHHAYARENCYYLTASCAAPRRIATAAPVAADSVITTHTVVTHVDNDLVNVYQSGQLWMGEKLSTAVPSRSFELRLPGTVTGDVKLRWAVASIGTTSGAFTLTSGDGYSRREVLLESSPYRSVTDIMTSTAANRSFTLTFAPSDNGGSGYLDYIELTAEATMAFKAMIIAVVIVLQSEPVRLWMSKRAAARNHASLVAKGGAVK